MQDKKTHKPNHKNEVNHSLSQLHEALDDKKVYDNIELLQGIISICINIILNKHLLVF